jgi:hypothetical protein
MGRLGDGPASGHPSIAISQSNVALVLKDLGELEEARDLAKKAPGAGHPSRVLPAWTKQPLVQAAPLRERGPT